MVAEDFEELGIALRNFVVLIPRKMLITLHYSTAAILILQADSISADFGKFADVITDLEHLECHLLLRIKCEMQCLIIFMQNLF